MLLPMEGDDTKGWKPGTPTVLLATPTTEVFPMFSPDGRWIAYFANDSGVMDVYVRPFPGSGGPWRISLPGQVGTFPRWSKTTPELLFLSQGKVMSAHYSVVGNSFNADKPELWSPTGFVAWVAPILSTFTRTASAWPSSRLGSRPKSSADKVVFVFNFAEYLQKDCAAGEVVGGGSVCRSSLLASAACSRAVGPRSTLPARLWFAAGRALPQRGRGTDRGRNASVPTTRTASRGRASVRREASREPQACRQRSHPPARCGKVVLQRTAAN
jgi:hypothetical protein